MSPSRINLEITFALRLFAACGGVVAFVAVGCLLAARVLAQAAPARSSAPIATDESGYKVMVPTKTLTTNKVEEGKYQRLVQDVLKGKLPLADNQAKFDSYYTWFAFPMMTQTTPEALREIPERRNRFFRTEVEIAASAEAHAHLVGLTLDQMSAIVQDTFHPAVRYNAMLIISSLNDQEVVRYGSERRLPEPMARALPVIFTEFQRPENSDAIKVAALIGLARHLEWDPHRPQSSAPIPAPLRAQIVAELLKLAQAKDTPTGRDAAGHLWFRRRAVEALGFACYGKVEQPVADALDQLLHDNSEPISLRCTIAVALGRMNFQAPAKLDTLAAAKELGYLALVACDAELNRVKELKQMETDRAARMSGQIQTGSGSGGGAEGFGDPMPMGPGTGLQGAVGAPPGGVGMPMPGVGGGGFGGADVLLAADPKGYRFDVVRRRIRQQLYCVQFGLTGGEDFIPGKAPVTPPAGSPEAIKMPPRGMNAFAKPGDEKKYVSDVYDKVRKLADVCENKATDMATLEKELRKNMKSLEAITKKLTPAPTPAGGVSPDAPGTPVAARAAAADAPAPMPPAAPKPSPPDLTAPAGPPPAGGAAPAPPPVGAAPAPTPPPAAGKPPAPSVPAAAP